MPIPSTTGSSYAAQSVGQNQLNIVKGPFDSIDVSEPVAAGATIVAGSVAHLAAGELNPGLVAGAMPIYMFTGSDDFVASRTDGQMGGGVLKGFRHTAPVELATTEYVGTLAPGDALTAGANGAVDEGKLRAQAAGEPIVGHVTKAPYKNHEGHMVIHFLPAWEDGVYA